ncbi:uncharacterized protein M6D78_004147 isoform 1-T2 [Vipera latastei]
MTVREAHYRHYRVKFSIGPCLPWAFNTILLSTLIEKLTELKFSPSICDWIQDFLRDRLQTVRVRSALSTPLKLCTGSPQVCVLSPYLYSLYTYDFVSSDPSTVIIKFADDTTVVGLITGGDETAYRGEVQKLSIWCFNNNLHLNIGKTKEIVLDFRRKKEEPAPLYMGGGAVWREFPPLNFWESTSVKILPGKLIQPRWPERPNRDSIYFLRVLRKNRVEQRLMTLFYRSTIESVLSYCIVVWYAGLTAADRKVLQRVVSTAQDIVVCPLTLDDIARAHCLRRVRKILRDDSHPGRYLFTLLPSGRRYRSIASRTNRLKNSFYPWAVRLLNGKQFYKLYA